MPKRKRGTKTRGSEKKKGELEVESAERDDREARLTHFYSTRWDSERRLKAGIYFEASRQRHRLESELAAKPTPSGPPPAPPGTAGSMAVNWTPLGPTVVAFGQAANNPAVSGR